MVRSRIPQLMGVAALILGALGLSQEAQALSRLERSLPSRYRKAPYAQAALCVGYPNHGVILRGRQLKPQGFLEIKANSREYAYGHPSLVQLLERAARSVSKARKGSVLLLGDLSGAEGGRIKSHASHQTGRDADVGFYVRDGRGQAVKVDGFVRFGANGRALTESNLYFDDYRNWLLLRALVSDPHTQVMQIFVAQKIRTRLLEYGRRKPEFSKYVSEVAALLTARAGHDNHFHVRVRCPPDQMDICTDEPHVPLRFATRKKAPPAAPLAVGERGRKASAASVQNSRSRH